jgi:hypothetical protein
MTHTRSYTPPGCTIAAVALVDGIGFAAGSAGVARCDAFSGRARRTWQRLPGAPPGVLCLAASPVFARDRTLMAGCESGLYLSDDGGGTWRTAALPAAQAMVLCIALSPTFSDDGLLLAGTRDDGIFVSADRGARWHNANFGMLDSTVLSLAFSPRFGVDQTVYAAAEGGLYFSYNGARAWKPLPFPDAAGLALSLCAVARADGVMLNAGSEQHGLWRSHDEGARWEQLLPQAGCINALASDGLDVIVAADGGAWRLTGRGAVTQLLVADQALCVAADNGALLAGFVNIGARSRPRGGRSWPIVRLPPMRALTGLTVSADGEALYAFGAREGAWRLASADVARIGEADFDADVNGLVCSPDGALLVAGNAGLWRSANAGATWRQLDEQPAQILVQSPDGRHLARLGESSAVATSVDAGDRWQSVTGPWQDSGAAIRAIAIDDQGCLRLAARVGLDAALVVWHAAGGAVYQVLRLPSAGTRPVSLWQAPGVDPEAPWYIAVQSTVWQCAGTRCLASAEAVPADAGGIVGLSGVAINDKLTLVACTGRALALSSDGVQWSVRQQFDSERALAVALHAVDGQKQIHVLFLGGAVRRI